MKSGDGKFLRFQMAISDTDRRNSARAIETGS
jgi:hypothetical protein